MVGFIVGAIYKEEEEGTRVVVSGHREIDKVCHREGSPRSTLARGGLTRARVNCSLIVNFLKLPRVP